MVSCLLNREREKRLLGWSTRKDRGGFSTPSFDDVLHLLPNPPPTQVRSRNRRASSIFFIVDGRGGGRGGG